MNLLIYKMNIQIIESFFFVVMIRIQADRQSRSLGNSTAKDIRTSDHFSALGSAHAAAPLAAVSCLISLYYYLVSYRIIVDTDDH